MDFQVELQNYQGPLDLLWYLVRKHEVEVADLPIAKIADQFCQYLEVLQQIDLTAIGDFLEVASLLLEAKSRTLLPHADEVTEEVDEARQELVRRLLEYKQFRDAASMLEERGRAWEDRFTRSAETGPAPTPDPATEPLHEVELWDLVSALARVLRQNAVEQPSSIVYDDTPIHVFMQRILERLHAQGSLAFTTLFPRGAHKSTLIGLFLALLELVRHHDVRAEQNENFGEIWVLPPPPPSPADSAVQSESPERKAESAADETGR